MERLRKRAEFLYTAGGSKWAGEAFVLQARARRNGEGAARTGFTASRKVGNAVARNRARRRLKEAVRAVLEGRWRPGHDYVVVARKAALDQTFADLLADLDSAIGKVHRRLDTGGTRRAGDAPGPRRHRAGAVMT